MTDIHSIADYIIESFSPKKFHSSLSMGKNMFTSMMIMLKLEIPLQK